jgi:hypothetical protein
MHLDAQRETRNDGRVRAIIFVAGLVALGGCGGKAVIDGGQGGDGGSGTTTTGASMTSTTSTTGVGPGGGVEPGCEQLTADLIEALNQVAACDSCSDGPDPCEYLSGLELTDTCGCPVPVNASPASPLSAALSAYQAWKAAGCGPFDCGQPCAVSDDPTCQANGPGCAGICAP